MSKHACPELIAAIAILATERDAWRKMETEMAMKQNRLKEQLAAASESRDAYKLEVSRTDRADDILLFAEERDRLKERVEKLRAALRLIQKASTVFSSCLVAKEALQSDEREG